MQRGRVLKFRGLDSVFDFFRQNKFLIILFSFYLFGTIFGVFSYGRLNLFSFDSAEFIEKFIADRTDATFFKIVADSMFTDLLIMLICFVCGSSLMGTVLVPFYISFFALFHGQTAAMLYAEYSLRGIAFHTVIILPSAVLLTVALILAARESVRFSLNLANLTLPTATPKILFYDFKDYCARYLVISVILLLSAILDAVISRNLLGKISIF